MSKNWSNKIRDSNFNEPKKYSWTELFWSVKVVPDISDFTKLDFKFQFSIFNFQIPIFPNWFLNSNFQFYQIGISNFTKFEFPILPNWFLNYNFQFPILPNWFLKYNFKFPILPNWFLNYNFQFPILPNWFLNFNFQFYQIGF